MFKRIEESKADHVVAFIDACRSGTIGIAKGAGLFDQDELGKRIQQFKKNKVIFTSGSNTQAAWEDNRLKQSVFTHYLLKGLKGQTKNQDGNQYVELRELWEYLRKKVEEHTENDASMVKQTPSIFGSKGVWEDQFPLALRVCGVIRAEPGFDQPIQCVILKSIAGSIIKLFQ